jgi:ATP-dependent RNA helicase DDX52/ROK1
MNRNTASESIKQKLIFAGSEEGKLLALRQSFAEVSKDSA